MIRFIVEVVSLWITCGILYLGTSGIMGIIENSATVNALIELKMNIGLIFFFLSVLVSICVICCGVYFVYKKMKRMHG